VRPGHAFSIGWHPTDFEVVEINAAPSSILLATDGARASDHARDAAAHLAREGHAALHIVHVWNPTQTVSDAEDVDEEIAAGVAGSQAALIESELHCPVAGVHTPRGSRAHAILATAGAVGAGLIVVGGRKLGIVEELFTYRVSEDVVSHSFRPVLLVRDDGHDWPPGHVVVGCDGSPEATRAARLATWIARLSGADVELIGVVRSDAPPPEQAVVDAGRRLEACAEAIADDGAATLPARVVVHGNVAQALRDACAADPEPHLLAIGARGSSALNTVPRFSVSRSVIHHTHVPLLLVPTTSREREDVRR
jgi:nucleotide-binding universal stress UspA family protein